MEDNVSKAAKYLQENEILSIRSGDYILSGNRTIEASILRTLLEVYGLTGIKGSSFTQGIVLEFRQNE